MKRVSTISAQEEHSGNIGTVFMWSANLYKRGSPPCVSYRVWLSKSFKGFCKHIVCVCKCICMDLQLQYMFNLISDSYLVINKNSVFSSVYNMHIFINAWLYSHYLLILTLNLRVLAHMMMGCLEVVKNMISLIISLDV